ncbi:MAG: hypothetical protein AB1529_03470 [Candidatus Micrarchaeota archaeon]
MRLKMLFKLLVLSLCMSLLAFALLPDSTLTFALKMMALGTVLSIAITAFYPEIRGIKAGDTVSVVTDSAIPSIIGRLGTATASGRKNQQIKIALQNGTEVIGVVESYTGLISPPRIRIIYEERLVD